MSATIETINIVDEHKRLFNENKEQRAEIERLRSEIEHLQIVARNVTTAFECVCEMVRVHEIEAYIARAVLGEGKE